MRTSNRSTKRISARLNRAGLPVYKGGNLWADTESPGVALRFCWWSDGIFTIEADTSVRLCQETELLLARSTATQKEMQRIIDLRIWSCLLCRCVLSSLCDFFTLASCEGSARRHLTPSQRLELEMVLDLFPLIFADLRTPFSHRIYASDACLTERGVTYTDTHERFKDIFATVR